MNKQDLKKFIKGIVRENLENRDCQGLTNEKKDKRQILARKFKKRLEESGYKIVSKNSVQVQKDNHALRIQTEPTVNENEKFGSCKGCGRVVDKGQDKCPKCRETQKSSLPPKKTQQGAKDPDRVSGVHPMKEAAYKTQGPSLKTFDDSPQFPDAVNNPKNA